MKVLIYQLDGKIPNLAVMRIAAAHRHQSDEVEVRWTQKVGWQLGDDHDLVYASAIFTKTKPVIDELLKYHPKAIIGGTGSENPTTLEELGFDRERPDYSDFPGEARSIGFTQRGCRLKCEFCVVPEKEGRPSPGDSPHNIWRGPGYPKHLLLLDNDFFGGPHWHSEARNIVEGGFRVSLNQGINARLLIDEQAEWLAAMDYRDETMRKRRIYTAWDRTEDRDRFLRGLKKMTRHGIKPHHLMVYVLVGYKSGIEDALERVRVLHEFGAKPYPMPYVRTPETVGFQRWVVRRYYHGIPWADFKAANYRPENL